MTAGKVGNPFEELLQPLKKTLDDIKTETWIKYILPVQTVSSFGDIVPTIKTGLYIHALSEETELYTHHNDVRVKDLQEFISDIESRVPIINRTESSYIFCNDSTLIVLGNTHNSAATRASNGYIDITTVDKTQLEYIKNLIEFNNE